MSGIFLSLILWSACRAPPPTRDPVQHEVTDTAVEHGGDSGRADSAGPVDTGADPVLPACTTGTEADLWFAVEARDATGACTACGGAPMSIAAVVANPCDVPLSLRTTQDQLIGTFLVYNLDTEDSMSGGGFSGGRTDWEVPANGTIDETRPMGSPVSVGRWFASVEFTDELETTAETEFEVPG